MADIVRETAPAKINLALHVGPPRGDGYHPVRTLMVALDGLSDTVEVWHADARWVECPGIDGPSNLAWKALDALERLTGNPLRLHVRIDKRIPSPAGLGGGSSDAAATLRAARTLCALDLDDAALEQVAAEVGSDAPFFVRGGAQWATGRGERLNPTELPRFWGVITHPVGRLSTPDVYATFDRMGGASDLSTPAPLLHEWWRDPACRNDLWRPALALAPRLGTMARALAAGGSDRVLLCGSGGAMVGLFRDEAAARAAHTALTEGALALVRPFSAGATGDDPPESPGT